MFDDFYHVLDNNKNSALCCDSDDQELWELQFTSFRIFLETMLKTQTGLNLV